MVETILAKFAGVIKNGNGYKAMCPSHDDKSPSLSVSSGATGNVVLHCHAGCETEAVLEAVGLTMKDLYPTIAALSKLQILATYDYCDETGNLLFQTVKYQPKDFRQRRPNGNGWVWKLDNTRRVPYRLPELLKADKAFPVFIVEGEKDVDNLMSIGAVATCNPQGAGKWRDEYSDHLKGFQCVILPDNDDAGEKHAQAVSKSLFRTAAEVSILRLPSLPDKGDVSDWIAKGNVLDDLTALLSGADNIEPELMTVDLPSLELRAGRSIDGETADTQLPKNYLLNENGIFYRSVNKDGEPTTSFVCSPLRITAKTCDADSESWGRRLQFEDAQHVKHDLVIPMSLMSGDGSELRARLLDCGLIIDPASDARQKFLRYLLNSEPTQHIRCVNQTGWHDNSFVLPDEVISANGNRDSLLLQNIDRTANKYKTSGSLSDWQQNVARYCVGNSRLMFAVNAAFASPLLPIAEETGGGFHLIGTSSTGKTTALYVAGSVWGGRSNKGFLDTWKSTGNGLEAVAELHNHSLLLLDEINEVNAFEVGEIVYALSNGFGKSRMNRNTTARRKAEWNLMFLSSGEETLEQKMQAVGQRTRGGQQARFVNIEADAGKGLGLFETLHGFESSNALADHLSTAGRTFYGTAIREYLHAVCADRKLVEARIKESRQMFQSKLRLRDASGEVFRVAARFSLVTVGGVLASEFGITNWNKAEVIECGERLFSEWLEARGTDGSYDTVQGVKQVLSFIAQHGSSRFQSFDKKWDSRGNEIEERIQNRAGFKRDVGAGQTEYLILSDIFEDDLCKGYAPRVIARELEKRGHLKRGSEKSYLSSKETLPELGRKRVYKIVFEGLSGDGE